MKHQAIFCLYILFYLLPGILCQTTDITLSSSEISANSVQEEDYVEFDDTKPHCFRFTWLGPEYDNSSLSVNLTCRDLTNDFKDKNIPCRQPLVITDDGTPPDMDYLWEKYQGYVLCRRSIGQACVKYSYSFNDKLQNVTYMCAKGIAIDEGPITDGCFTQSVNGYEISACFCESGPGFRKPCNTAGYHKMSLAFLQLAILIQFYYSRW